MKQAVMWASCLAAAVMPSLAVSAAQAQDKPIAVVSFAGYDSLVEDVNYVGKLAGRPQLAQGLEGILMLVTRAQGLVGLDKSKPIGAAISLSDAGQPLPLVFIPVTDVDKLLDALQGLIPNVEDLGNGISKIRTPNGQSVVMRKTDGWVFLSDSADKLGTVPADPTKLLGNLPESYDLAVQVNVKNVPEQFVQLAVAQLRRGAEQGMQKKPDEDEATYAKRKQFTEATLEQVAQAIQEIDHLTVGFEVDEEDGGAYLDLDMVVKAGGKLAAQIAASEKGSKGSIVPGFADDEAVANFHFVSPVLDDSAKMLLDLISLGRENSAKKIDEDDKLEDAAMKEKVKGMVSTLFDVAEATVKGGKFNGGAVVYGEGPFEFYFGGLFVDAKKVDKVFRDAVELFGDKPGVPEIKLDAATKGGVTYHTLTVPVPDKKGQEALGEEVTIAFGFGEKLIIIGIAEEDVVDTAAEVVGYQEGANDLPPAQLQIKVGPLLQFAVDHDDELGPPGVKLAELLADSDDDHITLKTEFVPNGQRTRLQIDEGLIEAIGKTITSMK
jgi:hypothetical protein